MYEPHDADAEQLRNEMAYFRSLVVQDGKRVGVRVRSWTDWRNLFTKHPWGSLAAAAVAGYLAIPRRKSGWQLDARSLAELQRNHLSAPKRPAFNVRAAEASLAGIAMQMAGRAAGRFLAAKLAEAIARRGQKPETPVSTAELTRGDQT